MGAYELYLLTHLNKRGAIRRVSWDVWKILEKMEEEAFIKITEVIDHSEDRSNYATWKSPAFSIYAEIKEKGERELALGVLADGRE
jgi:hypothetical protein